MHWQLRMRADEGSRKCMPSAQQSALCRTCAPLLLVVADAEDVWVRTLRVFVERALQLAKPRADAYL